MPDPGPRVTESAHGRGDASGDQTVRMGSARRQNTVRLFNECHRGSRRACHRRPAHAAACQRSGLKPTVR
jgi:hypothetical protein